MDRDAIYVHSHSKNNYFPIDFAIFTKALWTNGPTDQWTNQGTDISSFRDAIAASKTTWDIGWLILLYQKFDQYLWPFMLHCAYTLWAKGNPIHSSIWPLSFWLYKLVCWLVNLSVNPSVTDCLKHTTYGNQPCFFYYFHHWIFWHLASVHVLPKYILVGGYAWLWGNFSICVGSLSDSRGCGALEAGYAWFWPLYRWLEWFYWVRGVGGWVHLIAILASESNLSGSEALEILIPIHTAAI